MKNAGKKKKKESKIIKNSKNASNGVNVNFMTSIPLQNFDTLTLSKKRSKSHFHSLSRSLHALTEESKDFDAIQSTQSTGISTTNTTLNGTFITLLLILIIRAMSDSSRSSPAHSFKDELPDEIAASPDQTLITGWLKFRDQKKFKKKNKKQKKKQKPKETKEKLENKTTLDFNEVNLWKAYNMSK
ncbi:hypothetical protein PGB90_001134 [Kerria lacca]